MDITYSLLETTLAMCDALKYTANFKKFGIDSTVLPLLTDDDLKIIGIDDQELRNKLIKQCTNLPQSSESRLNLTVNEKYLMTALHEVDHHLLMLDASLTYALKRNNIQRCDIKLHQASKCLRGCIDSLQSELRSFHNMVAPKPVKKINKWKAAILALISATATGFVFRKYFYLQMNSQL